MTIYLGNLPIYILNTIWTHFLFHNWRLYTMCWFYLAFVIIWLRRALTCCQYKADCDEKTFQWQFPCNINGILFNGSWCYVLAESVYQ